VTLFVGSQDQVAALVDEVSAGRSVVVGGGRGKTNLLAELARRFDQDAVFLRVPPQIDRVAYVVLDAAQQCGAVAGVAEQLRREPSLPVHALNLLEAELQHRKLIIDDIDLLHASSMNWDLSRVMEHDLWAVRDWLQRRAAVCSLSRGRVAAAQEPVLGEPRSLDELDTKKIWDRTEHDADRYTIAVARQLLLTPDLDDPSVAWSIDAMLGDIWQGAPSDLRSLLSLLAIHGRPIERTVIEKLVTTNLLNSAASTALVEEGRGQVWLPTPWYGAWPIPPGWRSKFHEQLANSFAEVARQQQMYGRETAILEAHRHFASIPDPGRATEFAQFGAASLLEAAVSQSLSGEHLDAARTYEMVLRLDAQMSTNGSHHGIGGRARAYAIHYRSYNRFRARQDDPRETLAQYREALVLWPENALFWSRTIRCCFVAGDYEAAMRALRDAYERVPLHPQRDAVLLARTVQKLLQRGLTLPALLTWGEHHPRTELERSAEAMLHEKLDGEWDTKELWVPPGPRISFVHPVFVSLRHIQTKGVFVCKVLSAEGSGDRRIDAMANAAIALQGILARLLVSPHLDADNEDWLGQLLNVVDWRALAGRDENSRWLAYLAGAAKQVRAGEIGGPQHAALLRVLSVIRGRYPALRHPTAGRSEDGGYYLRWAFRDLPALTFSIDIDTQGRTHWLFRNAATREVAGSDDEPVERLPDEALDRMACFSR
jgi:tetratricopeptide (TPR) repeat protein